jgi:tetratricopeptide (TPR) repeat protein
MNDEKEIEQLRQLLEKLVRDRPDIVKSIEEAGSLAKITGIAWTYVDKGQPEVAIEILILNIKLAIEIEHIEEATDAQVALGYALYRDGQYANASEIWRIALQRRSDDPVLRFVYQQAQRVAQENSGHQTPERKRQAYDQLLENMRPIQEAERRRLDEYGARRVAEIRAEMNEALTRPAPGPISSP